jgi:hypothetical protein
MESMALEPDVSPQALQQHLGPQAEAFLGALLRKALAQALKIQPQALGLLDRFGSAIVEDTTVIKLPALMAEQFPGRGGGGAAGEGAAALKVLLRWDVRSGELLALTVHAGRTSDQTLAAEAGDRRCNGKAPGKRWGGCWTKRQRPCSTRTCNWCKRPACPVG